MTNSPNSDKAFFRSHHEGTFRGYGVPTDERFQEIVQECGAHAPTFLFFCKAHGLEKTLKIYKINFKRRFDKAFRNPNNHAQFVSEETAQEAKGCKGSVFLLNGNVAGVTREEWLGQCKILLDTVPLTGKERHFLEVMKSTFRADPDEEAEELYPCRTWPTAKDFNWLHGLMRKIGTETEDLVKRQKELQEQNDRELLAEINQHRTRLTTLEKKWNEIKAQREAERLTAERAKSQCNVIDFKEAKAKMEAKKAAKLARQTLGLNFPDGPKVA
jgi:hypothetical protein